MPPYLSIPIDASSSGNTTLVAAVTGKCIQVLQIVMISDGAVGATFQSGAGGTDLTGPLPLAASGGGFSSGFCPVGHFQTDEGELLNLNLDGSVNVGGWLVYQLVDPS